MRLINVACSLFVLCICLLPSIVMAAAAGPTLDIGSANTVANGQVTVPVTLTNNGANIASLSMDIGFDPTKFSLPGGSSPTAAVIGTTGTSSSKSVVQSSPSAGVLRVGVIGMTDVQTIGDGVVFTVTLNVLSSAPSGTVTLTNTPDAASPVATQVPITGAAGLITVLTASAPTLNIGTANAVVGAQVMVPVTLATNGASIAALSMDIGFDPTKFSLPGGSTPTAAVIGASGAAASKSVVQSSPVAGVLRVGVIDTNGAQAISDGIVFTVTLNVLTTAISGSATLTNIPDATSPAAAQVPITGTAGSISISSQPVSAPTLNIGTANAVAGTQVTVPVTLTTDGAGIAALSMDIGFDTTKFSLPGGSAPTAAVIGAAGTAASKSVVQSAPSAGVLRVGVIGMTGAQAMSDGVVFTVTLNVLSSAPSGTVTLTNTPDAASPAASQVPITGAAGSIVITSPQPVAAPTLNIGTASAVSGSQVTLPITLTTDGASIAALSMDIGFDTTKFSLPGGSTPTAAVIGAAGTAASKSLVQSSPSAGVLRVGVFDSNGAQAIGNGVVFTVTLNVLSSAPSGTVTLTNTPGAASPAAAKVPITGAAGSIAITSTPQPGAVPTLNVGNANAVAGGQVTVPVTLATDGASISSLSMDISFDTTRLSLPGGATPTAVAIGVTGVAASKSVYQSSPSPGVLRVGIIDVHAAKSIGTGVVFTVTFNVLANAAPGTVILANIPDAASPAATQVPISGAAGSITVLNTGSQSDVQKPVVTAFTIPATATSPTIKVSSFTATDNVGVTGYIITESSTAPAAGASGWMDSYTTSYTFTAVPEMVATTRSLYAWAKDPSGNVSNVFTPADITLTLPDLTPPAITNLSTLADGAVTNVPVQNISGTAIDASSPPVTVTVNGVSTLVNETTGAFNTSVTLINGLNDVTITATDSAVIPNTTTVVRKITLDTAAPGFTTILPADNSSTKDVVLTVSGTIDDPTATVAVTVNSGTPVTAALTGTSFTSQVTLSAGVNTINLTVTDPAANVTSAKRTITYDPTAPTLAITSPPQDAATAEATITIGGTVTDDRDTIGTVTVTVGGQAITPATAVTDGSFSQLITMPNLKTYAVTVSATDLAGNVATVQRNITRRLPNGALNGSAQPSLADALKVLNFTVGLDTLSASEKLNADVAPLVNGKPVSDGSVDVGDALVILKRVIGLLTW